MDDSSDICDVDAGVINIGDDLFYVEADFVPVGLYQKVPLAIKSSAEGAELNDDKLAVDFALEEELKHVSS